MKNYPFVSVIIPVYNDSLRLIKCLKAMKRQKYSGSYEVIVIDNGSDEELQQVMEQFPEFLFLKENRPGSYAARNKGITFAKGAIFAFTDSDCIPDDNWIAFGVKKLQEIERSVVGGKIQFIFKSRKQPNLNELYDSKFNLSQEKNIKIWKFSLTANLFVFKKTFDEIGMFNEKMMSCGDREWGSRSYLQGYSVRYAPEVVIRHSARESFLQLYKRSIRIAGGHYDLCIFQNRSSLKQVLKTMMPPIRRVNRIIRFKKISIYKKLMMILYCILFKYRYIFEIIRLNIWGKPERT